MSESKKKPSLFRRAVLPLLVLCPFIGLLGRPYFIRQRDLARTNSCICNLRQIDGAVQCWALEQKKMPGEKVTWKDITPFLKNSVRCPQGGQYVIGPTISKTPTCSIAGHALPQ
jgi:hypothetical protein